jgi:tetratricopeptide (TPR) repeat protein
MAGILFNNWAAMLIRAGRPLDAEPLLRRDIEIERDGQGEGSVGSTTLANYSLVLYQLARLHEAADYADRAIATARKSGDPVPMSQAMLHRVHIFRLQGHLAESSAMLARVAQTLRAILPPGHIAFALVESEQALNADAAGDNQRAMRLADTAVNASQALQEKNPGLGDYAGLILLRRAEVELDARHPEQALADASDALPQLQKAAIPGNFSAGVGHAYLAQGRSLEAEGKSQQAHSAFVAAAENLESALGTDHPDARAARALAAAVQ